MNRKSLGLLALPLLAMSAPGFEREFSYNDRGNNRDLEGAPPKNPPKVIPKGCKEFEIEGVKIVALNQKNAERKYLRLKSINKAA